MKTKAIIIGVIAILLLTVAAVRYRARQLSVTPGSLITPTEKSTLSAVETSGKPTATPAATKITLAISSPTSGATVTSSSIKVQGKTVPNAEAFVNEKETKADKNGNFSVSMTLDEGENYIIVMVNDAAGNVAEAELTVTYNP